MLLEEYKCLCVNGGSKKKWFKFYQKLCQTFYINKSIQLGLRNVAKEKIIQHVDKLIKQHVTCTEKEKISPEVSSPKLILLSHPKKVYVLVPVEKLNEVYKVLFPEVTNDLQLRDAIEMASH